MLNKRGQSVAEYAILIGVVIAAVVGMQLYVKRGLQGKAKAVVDDFATATRGGIASPQQYEPYYTASGALTTDTNNSEQPKMAAGAMTSIESINDSTNRTGNQNQGVNLGADDSWQ